MRFLRAEILSPELCPRALWHWGQISTQGLNKGAVAPRPAEDQERWQRPSIWRALDHSKARGPGGLPPELYEPASHGPHAPATHLSPLSQPAIPGTFAEMRELGCLDQQGRGPCWLWKCYRMLLFVMKGYAWGALKKS
jgi:hypothetical protein